MSSVELELITAIILPQYVLSPKRYVLIRILPEGAKSNALYQNPATIYFIFFANTMRIRSQSIEPEGRSLEPL